jgi:hypothetical protein
MVERPPPRVLRPSDRLLWFGVLGGASAWAVQLVVAYGVEEIGCSPGSSTAAVLGLDISTWTYLISAAAALVTIVSAAVCFWAWRGSAHRSSDDARLERVWFMGAAGFVGNLLFLAIIAYVAAAPLVLSSCLGTG